MKRVMHPQSRKHALHGAVGLVLSSPGVLFESRLNSLSHMLLGCDAEGSTCLCLGNGGSGSRATPFSASTAKCVVSLKCNAKKHVN